jgi:hypothetical protein
MSRPFVIDADAFKKIFDSLLYEIDNAARKSIELILQADHILIDTGGRIRQQWRACSCGDNDEYFSSWVSARLVEDKIREVGYKTDAAVRSKLDKFGMPRDDRVYIFVAVSNAGYAIVSEDSDFYDPKAKRWSAPAKERLREDGRGCVVRYMRRQFGIHIFPLARTDAHFR